MSCEGMALVDVLPSAKIPGHLSDASSAEHLGAFRLADSQIGTNLLQLLSRGLGSDHSLWVLTSTDHQ